MRDRLLYWWDQITIRAEDGTSRLCGFFGHRVYWTLPCGSRAGIYCTRCCTTFYAPPASFPLPRTLDWETVSEREQRRVMEGAGLV